MARMPGMMTDIVRGIDMDLAATPAYTFEQTETLLKEFDEHAAQLHRVLRSTDDGEFARTWRLRVLCAGRSAGSGGQIDGAAQLGRGAGDWIRTVITSRTAPIA